MLSPGILTFAVALQVSPPPTPPPAPPPPEEIARQGLQAAAAGDLANAARLLHDARAFLPHSTAVRVELARVLARQGQLPSALALLGDAAAMGAVVDVAELDRAFPSVTGDAFYRDLRGRFVENRAAIVRSTVAFTLPDRTLLPESVAWDPVDRVFFVGSMHRRKILRVDASGGHADFVPSARDGLGGVLGMKVDAARRELWVASCNTANDPPMDPPAAPGDPTGALHRYELPSGRLTKSYPFPSRPEDGPIQCFNDVVLDAAGNVYASAGARGVMRWDRATEAVEPFASVPGVFVNGLALSEDGRTLFLAAHTRGILAVDVASREVSPVPAPPHATLAGIDGLYVRGRTLIAIQNALAQVPPRVIRARLAPYGRRIVEVEVLERAHPAYAVPTTGVLVGDDLYYVAASNLEGVDPQGRLLPPEKLADTVILRLPLGG